MLQQSLGRVEHISSGRNFLIVISVEKAVAFRFRSGLLAADAADAMRNSGDVVPRQGHGAQVGKIAIHPSKLGATLRVFHEPGSVLVLDDLLLGAPHHDAVAAGEGGEALQMVDKGHLRRVQQAHERNRADEGNVFLAQHAAVAASHPGHDCDEARKVAAEGAVAGAQRLVDVVEGDFGGEPGAHEGAENVAAVGHAGAEGGQAVDGVPRILAGLAEREERFQVQGEKDLYEHLKGKLAKYADVAVLVARKVIVHGAEESIVRPGRWERDDGFRQVGTRLAEDRELLLAVLNAELSHVVRFVQV